jgi:hypothetical protein
MRRAFMGANAALTGVETRTSSPVCMARGHDFQSTSQSQKFNPSAIQWNSAKEEKTIAAKKIS